MRRVWSVRAAIVASVLLVGAVIASALLWPRGTPSSAPSSASAPSASTTPRTATATSSSGAPSVTAEPTTSAPQVSAAPPSTHAPTQSAADDSRSHVDVVVTVSQWNVEASRGEIGGYVAGLVEEGGSCSATFTLGNRTVEVSGPALADVSTTSCGDLEAPAARLGAGTWSVLLSYTSTTHSGTSAPVSIGVP